MKPETVEKARSYFPYLKKGIIYFNHASTGPITTKVKERIESFLKERSEEKIDDYYAFKDVADETKMMIGDIINCSGDRIAFLDNTTNGIIWLAQGIDWKPDDRIILNDVEFPANVYPFLQLKEKGVEVDFIKSTNGIVTAEEVIGAIQPKTKLISISFVQFLSGYRIDLEKIGKVCKEKGIIFSVDAIQGLGAVRLDIEKFNIDFLASGTQKWLLGLQGLAFIYVRKELQDKMKSAPIGWLAVKDAWNLLNFDLTTKETAERFQPGTLNNLGIYAFNSSMKLFKEFGFNEIEKQVTSNSKYFIDELTKIGYDSPLLSLPEKYLSGIVSFKSENAQKIFDILSQKKIVCSLREGYIRFAPHFYNTKQEIDLVVNTLKNICNLSLYELLKTGK
ncbi:MAG: aminotransferase class V-fold PLP-dependent enzyme [Ignavibacteriaceae bacterium]|nr:aminotransferase class V-fold PLP-dependent enzyme [Ignavibacteriaceae bacterium]